MVSAHFLKYKTNIALERSDMVLRCLVLDALDEVIYDGTRDIDNTKNTSLDLSIERTHANIRNLYFLISLKRQ